MKVRFDAVVLCRKILNPFLRVQCSADDLNLFLLSLQVTTEGYSGGFWDTEEQDKWFTHPRKLAGKCVKKVSSSKGVYTITSL